MGHCRRVRRLEWANVFNGEWTFPLRPAQAEPLPGGYRPVMGILLSAAFASG
jgi:hypothetical protein